MNLSGPDAGILKQWESRVHRWVSQGRLRNDILMEMTAANWTYVDADAYVGNIVKHQKRKWIIVMCVAGLFTVLSLIGIGWMILNRQGGNIYIPVAAGFCFVFSIVKFVKIKA